jgi:hypothetical protein
MRQQRADQAFAVAFDERLGRLYLAWQDNRFREDATNDILLNHSDDLGKTWSYPVRVNRGPTNDFVNRWSPTMALGPDGDIRISYRQRREAEDVAEDGSTFSPRVDTILQVSRDGGRTFTAPLRANIISGDLRFAAVAGENEGTEAGSNAMPFLGDYFQLGVGGRFTYIARAEAVRVSRSEKATFPPTFHHQRIWVAVVRT